MELFKKITWAVVFVLLIVSSSSCWVLGCRHHPVPFVEEDSYNVSDFTEMGVFTGGIEGPAINSKGKLFIVNLKKEGTIGKVDTANGRADVFISLPEGSIGNSIRFDKNDNMYVADYSGHTVLRISPEKLIDTVVNESRMNQPNDIAVAKSGIIYASDPNWGESTGNLWMVKNGRAILIDSTMGTTNGVELNLEENRLYVNESVQRNVWVYEISEDGIPINKTLFHKFEDFGMDGMKVHPETGNLFIARYGAGNITELDKNGSLVAIYKLKGEKPTNLAFSPDGKFIYVTMQTRKGVERIQL